MAIPSFFKQNKPRGFNYRPRYFDPVKDEMEQRRRAWAAENDVRESGQGEPGSEHKAQGTGSYPAEASGVNGLSSAKATEGTAYRSRIMRGDMKNYFNHRQEKVRKQTTIRLIVIILIIVLVAYLYLRF